MEKHEAKIETNRFIPPVQMFRGDGEDVVIAGGIRKGELTTPTYHVDFPKEGGVLCWHVGDKFPVKGWPFREAVYACDSVKRLVINAFKFIESKPVRYVAALFIFLPKSWKERTIKTAIQLFANYTHVIFDVWGRVLDFKTEDGITFGLQGVVWKPQFYCDFVREFRRVAMKIAGDDEANQQLVETICMIFEFDDAYRYRVQDAFEAVDLVAMRQDPGKELARIFALVESRWKGGERRFGRIGKMMPMIMRIGMVRKAVDDFFRMADLEKLSLDEIDFYRCLLWGGHAFRGIPDQERASLRIMIDADWQIQEKRKKLQNS